MEPKVEFINSRTGDRYERGKLLGKGGFALVYEIRDCNGKGSELVLADKVINKSSVAKNKKGKSNNGLDKIRQEIALHKKLRHPHIVR